MKGLMGRRRISSQVSCLPLPFLGDSDVQVVIDTRAPGEETKREESEVTDQ